MDVLISWSKTQSREMASVFDRWLPTVVPGMRPWMSHEDIDKGTQWYAELQRALSEATSCVICVTEENVRSPWIYYETGVIAAKKDRVLVCPYLVGIGVSMIADGPLGQYQCTEATKPDTLHLIKSLNGALPVPHDEGLIVGNFESKWPLFEQELPRILNMAAAVRLPDLGCRPKQGRCSSRRPPVTGTCCSYVTWAARTSRQAARF